MRWLVLVCSIGACARAEAQQPGWEIQIPERVEVILGGTAVVPIVIRVDRGLTVSKDAPVIVELAADAGVSLKKRRLERADAVDPEADAPRFAVAVKGDAGGDHVVKVRVKLWLCGGKVCRPLDVKRAATIAVLTTAPADAGVDAGLDATGDPRHRTP